MSSDLDPVDLLLKSVNDESEPSPFRVTGVMMQYYHVCERELWFETRDIEIDRENVNVVRGTRVDETAYSDKRRSLTVAGTIAIDLLEDGRVVEVKPSSALTKPAKMQLAYYLWFLKHVAGVETTGVLAHPREREREPVELTEDLEAEVETAIRDIYSIVEADEPPAAEEKPFCDSCAYHDFCWSC